MTYICYVNIEDSILQKEKGKVSLNFLLLTAFHQLFVSIGKTAYINNGSGSMVL